MYYAPYCGRCKMLGPHLVKIADETKDIKDLVIAKYDGSENEVLGLQIDLYPTLTFYPKGSSVGQKYDGRREAKEIK